MTATELDDDERALDGRVACDCGELNRWRRVRIRRGHDVGRCLWIIVCHDDDDCAFLIGDRVVTHLMMPGGGERVTWPARALEVLDAIVDRVDVEDVHAWLKRGAEGGDRDG